MKIWLSVVANGTFSTALCFRYYFYHFYLNCFSGVINRVDILYKVGKKKRPIEQKFTHAYI